MACYVEVKPELLAWARERAGFTASALEHKFPRLGAWERGERYPTLKQLETFAKVTHTPVGFLFLQEPPQLDVPIPDLRTVDNVHLGRPSPDLLETVYICQQRQEWYRDYARSVGDDPPGFVGSAAVTSDVEETAAEIRNALGFDVEERRRIPTWTDALRRFIEQADSIGVLVMCSGIVPSNTRRRLDPDEFRGFALADDFAPLVFVGGADTKAAQMFTLAHELAHIWLGQSALSDAQALSAPDHRVEQWCNRVAAELLVPLDVLRRECEEVPGLKTVQIGKRFARALVVSTLEGRTLYRDAFRLLGLSNTGAFEELGRSLGVLH